MEEASLDHLPGLIQKGHRPRPAVRQHRAQPRGAQFLHLQGDWLGAQVLRLDRSRRGGALRGRERGEVERPRPSRSAQEHRYLAPVTVTLRGTGLGEEQVVAVARHGEKVALAAAARAGMELSRARVVRAASSREPVYGVSTGFGALAGTRVAPLRQPELQLALIRSHAAGMGPPVEDEVVRATMLLRARTLAMGLSGVRPAVAEALIAMLNAEITPIVPRYGSGRWRGGPAPPGHLRPP